MSESIAWMETGSGLRVKPMLVHFDLMDSRSRIRHLLGVAGG